MQDTIFIVLFTPFMLGPYDAVKDEVGRRKLVYKGNKVYSSIEDVEKVQFTEVVGENRLKSIVNDEHYSHLTTIDDLIFSTTVEYFNSLGAKWCNLPLTTRMISSPGEVYRGQQLDYTTDALPVEIEWFDLDRNIFLSESSQFYLELRLLQDKIDKVYSIYNSFRKEKADFSHLAEFQHVEFEGKVNYETNLKIAIDLLRALTQTIISKASASLEYYLSEKEIIELAEMFQDSNMVRLSFAQAMKELHKDTNDDRYSKLSLENFGSWEEVRLTRLLGANVIVEEFPLMQIPFYHRELRKNEDGIPLSESGDIILAGYRETIGSGVRIRDHEALLEKAKMFNLPKDDYGPYIQMRKVAGYEKTAGFGLGWQRYVQWLLKLPFIWEATHVPRGHLTPRP